MNWEKSHVNEQQSRTKLLRHFRVWENCDRKNPLKENSLLLPLYECCFALQNKWWMMNRQSFQRTLSEARGRGNTFLWSWLCSCREICPQTAFVSASSVQDWSKKTNKQITAKRTNTQERTQERTNTQREELMKGQTKARKDERVQNVERQTKARSEQHGRTKKQA